MRNLFVAPHTVLAQNYYDPDPVQQRAGNLSGNTPIATRQNQIYELENLYRQNWNYFQTNVIPKIKKETEQAKKLISIFDSMRPSWKSMRQKMAQDPAILDRLDDQSIQGAKNSLSACFNALKQMQSQDIDTSNNLNVFQSQLERSLNAINQMVANASKQAIQPQPQQTQPVKQPGMLDRLKGWGQGIANQLRPQNPATAKSRKPILTAMAGSSRQFSNRNQ